jgi:hypothetical protein
MKTYIHFWSYLAHLFFEIVENIKTPIYSSITFFFTSKGVTFIREY